VSAVVTAGAAVVTVARPGRSAGGGVPGAVTVVVLAPMSGPHALMPVPMPEALRRPVAVVIAPVTRVAAPVVTVAPVLVPAPMAVTMTAIVPTVVPKMTPVLPTATPVLLRSAPVRRCGRLDGRGRGRRCGGDRDVRHRHRRRRRRYGERRDLGGCPMG
jgi:hypothetical protein